MTKNQYEIAIVGLSCKFPEAPNAEKFWKILSQGKEAIRFFSKRELLSVGIEKSVLDNSNFVPASGYLEDADHFDASFFDFSKKEAEVTDPQFRIFFECVWEALEDAGCIPDQFPGNIAIFAGSGMSLYAGQDMKSYFSHNLYPHKELISSFEHPQLIIANNREYLPTRLSYKLNLKGPSVNVQTACSTSLVAVHLACQSLLNGESDAAIAGASALHAPLKNGYLYKEGTFFSADGHCRVFDKNSQGIVGGNGAGVVVLKRLEDAIADRDNIRAIIKASAINNDGNAKVSYVAPSFEGQVDVIETAHSLAGITAESISFIEAHGTGTKIGDPIEISALSHVFRKSTNKKNFCALGSVKANIGHLDTAAGIASLIKTILALEKGQIPPQINFEEENPALKIEESPFYINKTLEDWQNHSSLRLAGVSSFGAGGTNAHLILQEHKDERELIQKNNNSHILTLSAKTSKALQELIKKYKEFLSFRNSDISLANICYTTNVGRKHFDYRFSVVCKSLEELENKLSDFEYIEAKNAKPKKIALLFTGQGSQYIGMAKRLYHYHSFFKENMNKCASILEKHLSQSILDILFSETEDAKKIENTLYAQPLLFAVEYSLAKVWLSWGIQPSFLMGHSLGEYVAACIGGVFNLEDALKLVATRAYLMSTLPLNGTMISIFTNRENVLKVISENSNISIASVNGPENVVITGIKEDCNKIADEFERCGIEVRPLRVSHAFHSHLMEPILEEFRSVAKTISYSPSAIEIVSNLTGDIIKEENTSADYWVEHLRYTVEFEKGIQTLSKQNVEAFLEIGPKPVLINLARQCLQEDKYLWFFSMKYGADDWTCLLLALQEFYNRGFFINWQAFHKPFQYHKTSLPTYAFERKPYYIYPPQAILDETSSQPYFVKTWIKRDKKEFGNLVLQKKHWLIFGESSSFTYKLSENLRKRGDECIIVMFGDTFCKGENKNLWFINPNNKDHYTILLNEIEKSFDKKFTDILFLSGMDLKEENLQTYIDGKYEHTYASLFYLTQALLMNDLLIPYGLTIITQGAQSIGITDPLKSPMQSPFWAFSRNLNVEFQEKFSRCLDIDVTEPGIELLIDNLKIGNPHEEMVLRGEEIYTDTISKLPAPEEKKPLTFLENATYLITGGMGAIGQEILKWMSSKGVKSVIVVGRSDPTPDCKELFKTLEDQGTKITIFKGDIANLSEMKNLNQLLDQLDRPLKGIIHAAGTLDDHAILSINKDNLSYVMNPKIKGTLYLHQMNEQRDLDFFVCFSSIAALLGSKGQANYAMANSFLNSFMTYRRQNNLPGLSINWGPWGKIGMAAQLDDIIEQYNLNKIEPDEGLRILEDLLYTTSNAEIAVISLKSECVSFPLTTYSFSSHIWNILPSNQKVKNFQFCWKNPNREDILDYVKVCINLILGERVSLSYEEDQNFHDMGIDSLMALQLREMLSKQFKLELSATLIYKYPTLEHLTNYLFTEIEAAKPSQNKKTNIDELALELEEELNKAIR